MPAGGLEVAFNQISQPDPRVPGSRLRNHDRFPPQLAGTTRLTEVKPQGRDPVDNLPRSLFRRMGLLKQPGGAFCAAGGELGGHDLIQLTKIPPVGWRGGAQLFLVLGPDRSRHQPARASFAG